MKDSRKTGGHSTVDELELLQKLLFGREKDRLTKLDRRVTDLELRTADVAEVLTPAMNRLVEDPVSQSEFEQPIVQTIRTAIKRDTNSFAEALFPVLGPAIRRAVADAMKTLVQRINVALENSFTVKGLRWRMEAMRTGVPFAQIVLRHTMVYSIQEAFLIQRRSGLVLASVHRDPALALDEDAVSAMLTAIQSFIQDSFGIANDEPLRSAELGDRTLWVINGPDAVLACIISGTPPRAVRDELMDLLETMHARFADQFNEHPEALSGNTGLSVLMEETLREEVDEEVRPAGGSRFRLLWIGAGLALAVFLAWGAWSTYRDSRLEQSVAGLFHAEPGYALTGHDFEGGQLQVAGLRDPMARSPVTVLEDAGIPIEGLAFAFKPYQSLDVEMVQRHLRRGLGLGDEVTLTISGSELSVDGPLTSSQFRALESLPGGHPVIRSVDLSSARLAREEALDMVRGRLDAPDSITLVPAGQTMVVSGTADAEWYAGAFAVDSPIGGWALDFSPLRAGLRGEVDQLIATLDGRELAFSGVYELGPDARQQLDSVAAGLSRLQGLARVLDFTLAVRMDGFTDGTGTADKNREVALNRARAVMQALGARGVETGGIELGQGPWSSGGADPSLRKVVLRVSGVSMP